MRREDALRRWCACIAWPGKSPVLFGTAMVRVDAPVAEVEAAVSAAIRACLPDGWVLRDLIPGAVFFQPEVTA